ncbi:MAG: b-glycosyltransferase-like protein [Micavibrio sp.]|nr:b-glycosyltransferase-like protein [Micavibrio sp.]
MAVMTQTPDPKELITLLIPCYNEQEVIRACHDRVAAALIDLPYKFEIIYINDGSQDGTLELLRGIQVRDPRVRVINLSRNFGKEAAMTAGLDKATGDAVIILDADMQDPPELISELLKIWKAQNADVVYGQRLTRDGETWLKKKSAALFYAIINLVSSRVDIPRNTGDFRLMNRRAVNALESLREHHRFMKGLFAWVGYKQVPLYYHREPRLAGNTKWNYLKLIDLALEGITGFSMTPLRFATLLGVVIAFFSFLFGAVILFKTLLFGRDIPGYASLAVMVAFFSGVQLLSIGLLGEYIGRIFNETKNRPLYLIDEVLGDDKK